MLKYALLLLLTIGLVEPAWAALDGDVRSAGTRFAVRQGATELAVFSSQAECEADARHRTVNPGSIRQRFEVKSGSSTLLAAASSQEECLATVRARLMADGATRTEGGNINVCVVVTNYNTEFQPPTCVSTFNFLARYTGTATPSPEPCNCPPPPVLTCPGTATLRWTPPTQNTDGSALTNLAGYRIHYGQSATALLQTVQVAIVSRHTIEGLAPGSWYFAVRAYTSGGSESAISNIVSKVVQQ